jgi:IclR family KDG regulon transcriptional repressor
MIEHWKEKINSNLPQTVERALDILETFVTSQTSLGITELGRIVRLNKSTIYRIVQALGKKGYVIQDEQTKKYRASYKILGIAGSLLRQNEFREMAGTHLEGLAKKALQTVQLAILEGNEVVFVDQREGCRDVIQLRLRIGDRAPLHCTASGKSILAFLREHELEELFKNYRLEARTPKTITTISKLKRQLQVIRKNGYSFCDAEFHRDIRAVGAPILGMNMQVIGSVVLSMPTIRMKTNQVAYYGEMVKETGRAISKGLGCPDEERRKDKV